MSEKGIKWSKLTFTLQRTMYIIEIEIRIK